MAFKKQEKSPSLKGKHKKAAEKGQDVAKDAAPKYDFSALDLREDAERQRARQSEISAGRAWPFLL